MTLRCKLRAFREQSLNSLELLNRCILSAHAEASNGEMRTIKRVPYGSIESSETVSVSPTANLSSPAVSKDKVIALI